MPAFNNGTRKFFNMASAPTGWTRDATVYDHAIVITDNLGMSTAPGGTVNFTTVHTNYTINTSKTQSISPTTSDAQDIPSHIHPPSPVAYQSTASFGTSATGYIYPTAAVTGYGYWSYTNVTQGGPFGYTDMYDMDNDPFQTTNITLGSLVVGNTYMISSTGTTTDAQWAQVTGIAASGSGPASTTSTTQISNYVGKKFTALGTGAGLGTGTVRAISQNTHSHTTSATVPFTAYPAQTFALTPKYVDLLIASKNGVYGVTFASQTATTVAKGSSVSITFNTPTTTVPVGSTIYYTLVDIGLTGAINNTALNGSFVTTGATYTLAITVVDNGFYDNGGAFIVQVRSDSLTGTIMATSQTINITEAVNPTITLFNGPQITYPGNIVRNQILEGVGTPSGATATFTFDISTTRIRNGELLEWEIVYLYGATAADFSATSGTFVVNNNFGQVSVIPIIDMLIDPSETFYVKVYARRGNTRLLIGNNLSAGGTEIVDVPPTLAFTNVPISIDCYGTGTFTISTTNVPSGTLLTWSVNYTLNNVLDFASLTGTFYVYNNVGTFYVKSNGVYTGTARTFQVIVSNSAGQTINTLASVTVNPCTVSIVNPITVINEGQSASYNISTTNIINGSVLTYKITPISPTVSADFASISGPITIDNNAGTFIVQTIANSSIVGTKTFTLDIFDLSGTNKLTSTSTTVSIQDIYAGITYNFISPPMRIIEGGTAPTLLYETNVSSGTLYWTINNITTANIDFVGSVVSGTITLNGTNVIDNNILKPRYLQSLTLPQALLDSLVEGDETFTVSLRTGSITGTVVATSEVITIGDITRITFVNPTYTIIEGYSATYTVNFVNVPLNTTFTWTINNITTSNADFSAVTGTFTNGSGTSTLSSGTFTITALQDNLIETDETFTITVANTGLVLSATSDIFTVTAASGQQVFTYGASPGQLQPWTVPAGADYISVVCIAGGGGGTGNGVGGGGGALMYVNGYPVIPGTVYNVVVGYAGGGGQPTATPGGDSFVRNLSNKYLCHASGGLASNGTIGYGGTTDTSVWMASTFIDPTFPVTQYAGGNTNSTNYGGAGKYTGNGISNATQSLAATSLLGTSPGGGSLYGAGGSSWGGVGTTIGNGLPGGVRIMWWNKIRGGSGYRAYPATNVADQ